jgi:hypothetical protein
MQGCIAPSEIPGITPDESRIFGGLAEDLIFADYCGQYGIKDVFQDDNNPAAYLLFLETHNPHFTKAQHIDYYVRLRGQDVRRVPDILAHKVTERAFYEVKPDSPSGRNAGIEKIGRLSAIYKFYALPYTAGRLFMPRDITVAALGSALRATLRSRRPFDALILYRLCIDSQGVLELAVLAALLRHIVREMNKQKGQRQFRPVDLAPLVSRDQHLTDLARTLGLSMVGGIAVAVGWRHFWKAVVARFAVRGTAAAALAAADGPLPVGDLLALGLTLWTVIDIIRYSDQLWRDADRIARRGA